MLQQPNKKQELLLLELCKLYLEKYAYNKDTIILYSNEYHQNTAVKFSLDRIPWWEIVTYHLPIKMLKTEFAIVGLTANMMNSMLKGVHPIDYLYNIHKNIINTCVE